MDTMNNEEKKKAIKTNTFPLAVGWSLVAMADRINEGAYVKFTEFDQESGNVKYRPNREIIKDQIALGLVNVTEADRQFGNVMHEHFQGISFNALTSRLGDFDQKILSIITKDEIEIGAGMAYLACMAARYRREIVKENKQEILLKIGSTSSHQGSIGQHLRLNVHVISKFEGRAFPGSVVRVSDDTNMYFWTSSKHVSMWPDAPEKFPIVGIVKSHGADINQIPETRLTRVKIAE